MALGGETGDQTVIIYKYQLNGFETTIDLPVDAKVIHAGIDPQGKVCVWCMVGTRETRPRRFYIQVTGETFEAAVVRHVGSYVQGDFVGHVFMELTPTEQIAQMLGGPGGVL